MPYMVQGGDGCFRPLKVTKENIFKQVHQRESISGNGLFCVFS